MSWRNVGAIVLTGLLAGGCVVSIDETVSPKLASSGDFNLPIAEIHYEAEFEGEREEVHRLMAPDDPDRAAVVLFHRAAMASYRGALAEVEVGDGTSFSSPVFLARGGGLLVRRGSRYYQVGTYSGTAGPGPLTPSQKLEVRWQETTFEARRHHTLPDTLFILRLSPRPRTVSSPDLLVPDCNLPPDRREPAALYYVEPSSPSLRADKPFFLKTYVDGQGRGYALTRLPVADTFKAEVDPVARTITVTGDVSYPDASPEKGCAVVGGKGDYHTPVTVEIPVTVPAGTYTVRIPETHYRSGVAPDITQNYFSKSSRQELTITVQ